MQQITREGFTKALQDAVADAGDDYVYPRENGCQYVHNGAPSCLIGHALHRMGAPIKELATFDSYRPGITASAETALRHLGCPDSRLRCAAEAAQQAQDDGKTWGRARDVFLRVLNGHSQETGQD